MLDTVEPKPNDHSALDEAVSALAATKDNWAQTSIDKRMSILAQIKERTAQVAEQWVEAAVKGKQIPEGSPLAGEEWMSGPYSLIGACNALLETLSKMDGKKFLAGLKKRRLPNGNLAVQTMPNTIWDRLLLSGISAEVWMQEGITAQNLAEYTATAYDKKGDAREAKIALVLGAGNIASIAPLDCLHKLFSEHQVVILKLNPVNDYLYASLDYALRPLIEIDALRIVKGGGDVGAYLCTHPSVEEIHITGAGATHDAIVWGVGEEAEQNKRNATPINTRRITSELGAVCPTIVVPGPWSWFDIQFQAQNVASQKLNNSGFNCVALQALLTPSNWPSYNSFMSAVKQAIANAPDRGLYYPGAQDRLNAFAKADAHVEHLERGQSEPCRIAHAPGDAHHEEEVFGPAFSVHPFQEVDPEDFLRAAIAYANEHLHGTLGANIIIHPKTLDQIGRARFDAIITDLKYGCIAINAWTGLGFLTAQTTWGAFPGHTLDDVQSGIGVVHNSYMFDRTERTVIWAPFRPYPRGLLSGKFSFLPKPPWFVNHKTAASLGRKLTAFAANPSFSKLPSIFFDALRG